MTMTREEFLKEAAVDYASYLDGTDQEYDKSLFEAFKDGASWADKYPVKKQTIWHDANECPYLNSKIVIVNTYGDWFSISEYNSKNYRDCDGEGWESCVRHFEIDKWAYSDDLINL